jgi:transcriptional regulator of acetoin/glycerol metabolism
MRMAPPEDYISSNGYSETGSSSIAASEKETGLFGVDRPGVAWNWMKQSQQAPEGLDWVRPQVAEAWRRCLEDYGLRPEADLLNGSADEAAKKQVMSGIKESLLELTYNLYSYLLETGVTLLVMDASGSLIHVMNSGLQLCPAGRRLVQLGVSWSEDSLGNSGLGTAAVLREPVAFDGKEHFYSELHPFATAGYPIFQPDGQLLATLGIITDRRDSAQSMLAFLRLAGSLVELNLFKRHGPAGFLIQLRPALSGEIVGMQEALFDGMLNVDDQGCIHGVNRTALLLLGYQRHEDLLNQNINQVLDNGLQDMIARLAQGGGALEVKSPNGMRLLAEAGAMQQNIAEKQEPPRVQNFAPPTNILVQVPKKMREELEPPKKSGGEVESSGISQITDHTPKQSNIPLVLPAKTLSTLVSSSISLNHREDTHWKDSVLESALQQAIGFQDKKIQILITGESGVGKDYLVRCMHAAGPRKDEPLVAINCASIPRELIESELFGYEPGSFTGANSKGKPGKFLLADKGVLFLDEIGDMALDLQATLLRVLDSSEFVPVGGRVPIKVNVHVVAATHCRLQDKVREGTFRRDLYYRLNGAQVWLPPLRERPDKMRLIQSLLERERHAIGIYEPMKISEEVWEIFLKHPWPGNIRELTNLLRSSIAMSDGEVLRISDLPWYFLDELRFSQGSIPDEKLFNQNSIDQSMVSEKPLQEGGMALVDFEIQGIRAALASSNGNISEAARILGVTRATLYHKMTRYELRPKS